MQKHSHIVCHNRLVSLLNLNNTTFHCVPSQPDARFGLTHKYWAYGGGSFKVRGIEMRQHSTPPWIRSLQEHALAILVEGGRSAGIPDRDAQRRVLHFYHEEVRRLQQRMVPLNDLVLTRRVSKNWATIAEEPPLQPSACPSTGSSCAAWGRCVMLWQTQRRRSVGPCILVDELPLAKEASLVAPRITALRRACDLGGSRSIWLDGYDVARRSRTTHVA